jgi:hypothetical protein
LQILSRADGYELIESPRHYPDDDRVQLFDVAAWVPEVPAYGVRCFPHRRRPRTTEIPHPAEAADRVLTNGRIRVAIGEGARITLADAELGRTVPDLLWWECVEDLGDEYTPSPRGVKLTPEVISLKRLHRGPVRAVYESRWRFRSAGGGRRRTGRAAEQVEATRQLIVDADARWLRIHVAGINAATNHRLRIRIATGIANPLVVADAMFGPVERRAIVVSDVEARFERPLATAPLHRYVSLFSPDAGATVFSDGLAEYEVDQAGNVYVTLVRAVGELSRDDIPERPGHAGWPTPTPEAQCRGPFAGEFAVLLHGPRAPQTIEEIELAAEDILLPLTGATLRSALEIPAPVRGVELEGAGLAFSAAKESEDGRWLVLRCVNLVDRQCAGNWRLGWKPAEAQLARLDETPLRPLVIKGDTIPFRAGPRAVVTIMVR